MSNKDDNNSDVIGIVAIIGAIGMSLAVMYAMVALVIFAAAAIYTTFVAAAAWFTGGYTANKWTILPGGGRFILFLGLIGTLLLPFIWLLVCLFINLNIDDMYWRWLAFTGYCIGTVGAGCLGDIFDTVLFDGNGGLAVPKFGPPPPPRKIRPYRPQQSGPAVRPTPKDAHHSTEPSSAFKYADWNDEEIVR